ncbi:ABC transporter permease [Paenibacillus pinistramenti]|uniref:ABC transporter permease n=1 Tax=Paenibacillus pinistramenti TaxID=1768003 RepID=UPI001109B069|nr:ABC transporter permease [Paenibacillus pinistramenti]
MITNLLRINRLIFELSKSDFKKRYLGNYLGIVWAFIQPLISLLLFWFVFQVGFRNMPVDDAPFILWLACAMIPWNFFAEAVQASTVSVIENSFLVKKVVFRLEILPVIKIYSALFVHLFFIVFLFVMFLAYGYGFTLYDLQILYYLLASIVLILGISWITSSVILFFKDTGQIVAMLVQFGFWLTPIFYSINTIPERFRFLLKMNPMYYITDGYRRIFIYRQWFWQDMKLTLYFWAVTISLLCIGFFLYRKLKPHFADVL